jgi:hypothetical protein
MKKIIVGLIIVIIIFCSASAFAAAKYYTLPKNVIIYKYKSDLWHVYELMVRGGDMGDENILTNYINTCIVQGRSFLSNQEKHVYIVDMFRYRFGYDYSLTMEGVLIYDKDSRIEIGWLSKHKLKGEKRK